MDPTTTQAQESNPGQQPALNRTNAHEFPSPLSYDNISTRIKALEKREGYQVSVIGRIHDSGKDFPLYKVTIGRPETAVLKVLISGGIHGEEPGGVHSALEFLESTARDFTNCYFEVYPCVNPSGFEKGCRNNPQGKNVNRCFESGSEVPEVMPLLESLSPVKFDVAFDLHEDKNDELDESSTEAPPVGLHAYESSPRGSELAEKVLATFPSEMVFQGNNLYGDVCKNGVIWSQQPAQGTICAQGKDFEQFVFREGIARQALTLETCIFEIGTDEKLTEIPLIKRVACHQQMISVAILELLQRAP